MRSKSISNVDLSDVMTRSRAQKLVDKIAEHINSAWDLLLEAHQRQAWKALGYTSWETFMRAEFHIGRSRSYQLLDQANVIGVLTEAAGEPVEVSEAVARDIKPALPEVAAKIANAVTAGEKPNVQRIIEDERAKAKSVHKSGKPIVPDQHIPPKAAPKPSAQLSLFEEREGRALVPSRPPASDEEAAAAKALGRRMFEWGSQRDPKPTGRENPYVSKPNQGKRRPAPTAPTAPKGKAEKCMHPVTRRIGDGCGACGQKVGGK